MNTARHDVEIARIDLYLAEKDAEETQAHFVEVIESVQHNPHLYRNNGDSQLERRLEKSLRRRQADDEIIIRNCESFLKARTAHLFARKRHMGQYIWLKSKRRTQALMVALKYLERSRKKQGIGKKEKETQETLLR